MTFDQMFEQHILPRNVARVNYELTIIDGQQRQCPTTFNDHQQRLYRMQQRELVAKASELVPVKGK